MKKILIITDSLGLPRDFPEKCSYENTWPVLLKNEDFMVHQVSIGGATSSDLLKQCKYHKAFNPDIVFVQVGIVDCAPRFMTRKEMNFIAINSIFEKIIFKLMAKDRIRNYRKVSNTSPKMFEKNLNEIVLIFKEAKVYFIEILPISRKYEKILPGIVKKAEIYNKIIQKFNFIKTDDFSETKVMTDFHHLSEEGNFDLSKRIQSIVAAN